MTATTALLPGTALQRAGWLVADEVEAGARQLMSLVRRQPPQRWFRGSDALPEAVLLPGLYEHWSFLWNIADALNAAGYRVRVLQGLGMNGAAVDATADRVGRALARRPAPAAGRVLIGHSKGGLIGKHLLIDPAHTALGLVGEVTVCTPFAGTTMARYLRHDPNIRELRPDGPLIQRLRADASVNHRIVSIAGAFDAHVPDGAHLDGAVNLRIASWGHFHILAAPQTAAAVLDGVRLLGA